MKDSVSRLITDEWSGLVCKEVEGRLPSWEAVEGAVRALDAKVKTILSLYKDEDSYITVGGGAGRYVVYVSEAQEIWNLLCNSGTDLKGKVVLCIGGQDGDFPARQVVNLPAALAAIRTFFHAGKIDPLLPWERQP